MRIMTMEQKLRSAMYFEYADVWLEMGSMSDKHFAMGIHAASNMKIEKTIIVPFLNVPEHSLKFTIAIMANKILVKAKDTTVNSGTSTDQNKEHLKPHIW